MQNRDDVDIIEKVKKEMIHRKLSHKTIMTYLFYIKKFLVFCDKSPRQFSKKDCREFLEQFMEKEIKKGEFISGSTL